jgi:flavin-dependent dehydrogenase
MHTQRPIAIVGGGPAGALAAEMLAAGQRQVLLFDEKLAWEKPCGGGVTHKALQQYPFLAEVGTDRAFLEQCELISPSGHRVRFNLRYPLAIFSRLALNGLLLDRAGKAGADIRKERVTRIAGAAGDWLLTTPSGEYCAAEIVLAAGARNPFRGQFLSPVVPQDLMVTAGYFIPGRSSLVQIQFLKGISGYIWVFPRPDHLSAGIAARMGETASSNLRRTLEQWLRDNGFSLDGARFYSHILPAFRVQTLDRLRACDDGWAMVGDSAGLVDPITGEGLYYALRSAELCAESLLAGRPAEYQAKLEDEILPELSLAARVSQRFYSGQVFGESVLERMVAFTQQSEAFRNLMRDLFAGIQGYRDLRSRLYRTLPSMMAEGLAATLRLPWNGSGLATDPFAE